MENKDDKTAASAKVSDATAGVEKLSISKKKKLKFVKVDPKELNIVIDDGRGRDTDFRNNKPNHVKSQESRKSSSHHQDKGLGSSTRHSNTAGGASSRNMSRGSGKHPPSNNNYKADFEVNEDSTQQHNKKHKRESSKVISVTNNQQVNNDKDFKNNLMWDGDSAGAKKSRNQWKNLDVNNITNKTRERLMNKPASSNDSLLKDNGDVDSRTTTASILDSSLYQNTYDSKTRNFVDSGSQIFNAASTLNETPEHSTRDGKLFSNEALYAPSSTTNYPYTSSSTPTYAAMTTASGNANNVASNGGGSNNGGVYSTNSFMAATTHGYSSISNTITNTQPSQQQSNNSVYSSTINSYSSFPQQSSVNLNTYGHQASSLSNSNTTGYSSQNLYQQQPSSVSYSSNSYVYPQTSIATSSNVSSTSHTSHKYPPYNVDMKNHLDSKSTLETKSSSEHPPYVDYPNYMGTQYQDSLMKDVKTAADPIGHFEFRNTLDIAPMIPMDSYMTNYMQPGPPPQSTSDYKMLYWNNVPMPNMLHAPPPQAPHSAMYKYTSHIPYDMPTSQATQKPFMKLNDSTSGTDTSAYISPTHMRVHTHQIPTHRYPVENTTTNKMPLAYTEPQPPNLQASLNDYQRYQNERHHFTDFGNFQTPPLGNSVQHNYQTNDSFGTNDLSTRIHQQPTAVHPYFNSTDENSAQRYGIPDVSVHSSRNKRAITGGTNHLQHLNSRTPHYQHNSGYSRHLSYEDKDLAKPPVPHTSGNIYVNHNKYEPQYIPPTVLPSSEKSRKPISHVSPPVVTSIITSTATSNVTTTTSSSETKPAESDNKLPSNNNPSEEGEDVSGRKNAKVVPGSPAKSNNMSQHYNEKGHKSGGERQRDRGDTGRHHQFQNNMIKTIDFHQFQNNVMKNHPGNKNFKNFNNKSYGDKNKNEFKVTKIMQRPVDENKDEIAKLPIPLGGDKKDDKKVDDKNVSKDQKITKSTNNNLNKKTNKQQNIQILSPAKKPNREEDKIEKEENNTNAKENDEKSTDDEKNKLDDKAKDTATKLSNSADSIKLNKKDEGSKENKPQQQRRKFNNFHNSSKYQRHPYHNNGGDFNYVPVYDGNINKFNKFGGGGNNRYPNHRYYDFDFIDPRSCFFPGSGTPYPQYGGGGPPMFNNLYNSNNYNNNKSKQKKTDSTNNVDKKQDSTSTDERKKKATQKQQQSEEESKKTSNKKIKFKGPEILNETTEPTASSATNSNVTTVSNTADNSNNPSSILKKSKATEDCKVKTVQGAPKTEKSQTKSGEYDNLDEREPSTIQLFMGLGLDKPPSQKPLVYPIRTFNMDIDDMTSREIFEDVYADIKTHQTTYKDKQLIGCFHDSIINNSHLFKDKIVLEVGCGMGLLSLFCAEAGAKHVISVDCSVITQLTQEVVEENDCSDVITVICRRMEDIDRLPHGIENVDIIVSNWMGHVLYLDSLINAVVYARDRFLKPHGLILPDRAELYCVAANDTMAATKYSFWHDVYGFDMEPIQRDLPNIAKFHPVPGDKVMTDSILIHSIDLNTCSVDDTSFNLEFAMVAKEGGFVNAFVLYFKTYFLDCQYVLDTSPDVPSTHWAQTVLFIDKTILLCNQATLLCNLEMIRLRDKQNSIQCNITMDYLGYPNYFFEKKYILSFY
ncbi:hypothetical protein M8J76_009203 [Diaphorina citri]|nr:hypothetical protein M8J75_013934 [Diaphorina citri]KAI5745209.1 hypothetical protein M8J76_009203 [Diaphorina citri]